MNKKRLLGFGSILLIIVIIAIVAQIASQSNLTDEQIKQKFECGRVTADSRPTDVYCSNPSLYREHLKNDAVIAIPR